MSGAKKSEPSKLSSDYDIAFALKLPYQLALAHSVKRRSFPAEIVSVGVLIGRKERETDRHLYWTNLHQIFAVDGIAQ